MSLLIALCFCLFGLVVFQAFVIAWMHTRYVRTSAGFRRLTIQQSQLRASLEANK